MQRINIFAFALALIFGLVACDDRNPAFDDDEIVLTLEWDSQGESLLDLSVSPEWQEIATTPVHDRQAHEFRMTAECGDHRQIGVFDGGDDLIHLSRFRFAMEVVVPGEKFHRGITCDVAIIGVNTDGETIWRSQAQTGKVERQADGSWSSLDETVFFRQGVLTVSVNGNAPKVVLAATNERWPAWRWSSNE